MIQKIKKFLTKNKFTLIFLVAVLALVVINVLIDNYYISKPTIGRAIIFILFDQFISHFGMILIVILAFICVRWYADAIIDDEFKKKKFKVAQVAMIIFLFGYLMLTRTDYLWKYSLEGDKQSFIEFMINASKDLLNSDYDTIKVDNIEFEQQSFHSSSRSGGSSTRHTYFVNINNDQYVLPYSPEYRIERVLKSIGPHEITVYKNTKMISSVDGCPINEITDKYSKEFEQKRINSQYTLSVENNIIKVINNYNQEIDLAMNYCDSEGNIGASINYTGNELSLDYGVNKNIEGKHKVYLMDRYRNQVSNIITFECLNGEIRNIVF